MSLFVDVENYSLATVHLSAMVISVREKQRVINHVTTVVYSAQLIS